MSVYVIRRANAKRPATWHVRWSKGKYEPYVYLGSLDTKARAEARKHKVLDLLAIGIEPTLAMFKHVSPIEDRQGLHDAAKAWMGAQVQWEASTRTVRESYVRLVVDYFGAKTQPRKITVDQVQAWIRAMTEGGIKPTTQRARLNCLSGILAFAKHPDNPVRSDDLKRAKGRAARRPLPSILQLAGIRERLNPLDRALFDVLEHTGMRVSEATSMTWAEVDAAARRLVGRGTKSFERVIPVLDGQPDWLPVKPEGADPDALVYDGLTSKVFAKHLATASGEVGFHLNPNRLRHVHASRLLAGAQGGGLETSMGPADMAYRMGHSVPVFLSTYTHRIPPS